MAWAAIIGAGMSLLGSRDAKKEAKKARAAEAKSAEAARVAALAGFASEKARSSALVQQTQIASDTFLKVAPYAIGAFVFILLLRKR